jgi:hypothetical protein
MPSTFQNAKDEDIQNTFASFTCGCGKRFLFFGEECELPVFGTKRGKYMNVQGTL